MHKNFALRPGATAARLNPMKAESHNPGGGLLRTLACALPLLAGLLLTACATRGSQTAITATPQIEIVSREEWGARPPVAEMQRHEIRRITIHHTATPQKPERTLEQKMQGLQQFSQNEGKLGSGKVKPPWPDVPYHYYIDVHGRIAEGRSLGYVGDTNTEYNPTGHALVVLEGNFENEQPSPEQLSSLHAMVTWLAARYKVAPDHIEAHNDFAQTLCPGKNLKSHLPALRTAVSMRPK